MTYPTDGTVSEVTDWIGENPKRASEALAAENERDSPRKGVLDYAERIATQRADGDGTITFRHVSDGRTRSMPAGSASVASYDRHKNWKRA